MIDGLSTWSILIAIASSPLIALVVQRYLDDRKATYDRQRWVLGTLMGLRGRIFDTEHIRALNLIQLEFAGVPKVLTAWNEFIRHVETAPSGTGWGEMYKARLDQLLDEIAAHVRVKGRHIDLSRGGYYPVAWGQQNERSEALQKFVAQVAEGEATIPIEIKQPQNEHTESLQNFVAQLAAGKAAILVEIKQPAGIPQELPKDY